MSTGYTSFPRYMGEGRDGGVAARRVEFSIAPIPVAPSLRSPPRGGGRSRLVIMVISCIKYEAPHLYQFNRQ